MSGKLMKEKDYEYLESCQSVEEFVAYLSKKEDYIDSFNLLTESNPHREVIESVLKHSLYKNFSKIYSFSNHNQKVFLDYYVLLYEASAIKTLLRHYFIDDYLDTDLSFYQSFFEKFAKLDVTYLYSLSSLSEFLEALKGNPFGKVLSNVYALGNASLYDYESQIDLYYFSQIWNSKEKYLKGEDLEIIKKCYGTQIDLLNISWIYRAKRYYNLEPLAIYKLIIPINYKIKKQELKAFVETKTLEELDELTAKTKYYIYTKAHNPQNKHLSADKIYLETIEKINKSETKKNPYSVAIINYYLYQKEKEIQKLTSILEMVRYGITRIKKEDNRD